MGTRFKVSNGKRETQGNTHGVNIHPCRERNSVTVGADFSNTGFATQVKELRYKVSNRAAIHLNNPQHGLAQQLPNKNIKNLAMTECNYSLC